MKKLILFLLPVVLIIAPIIPYLTGVGAEREFPRVQENLYQTFKLRSLDNSYKRGWFSSSAQSLVESASNRFILAHHIDHGFLPIQPAQVRTTLHVVPELGETSDKALLEALTTVRINGDSVSTFKMPARQVEDDNVRLQWQDLEGTVFAKRNMVAAQIEMHSPQVQLDTEAGYIKIQNLSLAADVQSKVANLVIGEGSLNMADILLAGKEKSPVILKDVNLAAHNNLTGDNLMVAVKTRLQQMQVGNEPYGPSHGDFELLHWHMPTLINITNTLVEIQNQGLSLQQQSKVAKFRLVPYGLTLLKNTPEFAITRFNLNMPEGDLRGTLRLKMEPFGGNFLFLFKPFLKCMYLNLYCTRRRKRQLR